MGGVVIEAMWASDRCRADAAMRSSVEVLSLVSVIVALVSGISTLLAVDSGSVAEFLAEVSWLFTASIKKLVKLVHRTRHVHVLLLGQIGSGQGVGFLLEPTVLV